jgi:hypothetical protein
MAQFNKVELFRSLKSRTPGNIKLVFGLENGEIDRHWGTDFFYIDHAYFNRGWDRKNFRLVRGSIHRTNCTRGLPDRLERFNVKLKPYRNDGRSIVVLRPGEYIEKAYARHAGIKVGIADAMAQEVRRYTDRPIVVKNKSGDLIESLKDAWAVVCPFSVAGVYAAVHGVPVFSTPLCPTWPISSGSLNNIEQPQYHDRYEWANSLAWASWNLDELKTVPFAEYPCA